MSSMSPPQPSYTVFRLKTKPFFLKEPMFNAITIFFFHFIHSLCNIVAVDISKAFLNLLFIAHPKKIAQFWDLLLTLMLCWTFHICGIWLHKRLTSAFCSCWLPPWACLIKESIKVVFYTHHCCVNTFMFRHISLCFSCREQVDSGNPPCCKFWSLTRQQQALWLDKSPPNCDKLASGFAN